MATRLPLTLARLVAGGGPPCGILRRLAPTLPGGQTARLPQHLEVQEARAGTWPEPKVYTRLVPHPALGNTCPR